jgi:hypothetical protein
MNKIEGYKTSKNYELLFQLMQKSSIICIVDFISGTEKPPRDIAQTIYSENGSYGIYARGCFSIYAKSKDHFIKECIKYNVEFIEPTEITHA